MKETLKLGVILLIITVVSAGVLAVSNDLTKDRIDEIKIAKSLAALEEIFGQGYEFETLSEKEQEEISDDATIVEIVEAYKDDTIAGYAIKTKTSGYGGDLVVLTGISQIEGQILGMKLLEHKETKGIGTKATQPEYEEEFQGIDVDEEATEAITGATVTSTGVLEGVNIARELYKEKLVD